MTQRLLQWLLLFGVAATSVAAQAQSFTAHSMYIGGTTRTYLVRKPTSAPATGAPVIIMLHGHGGTAAKLVGQGALVGAAPYRAWVPIADRERLVLIAPNGAEGFDGEQGWNDCRRDAYTNPRRDDAAFMLAILDAVGATTRIDRRRVFVVGTSNGGHMALRMAIEQPTRVAGVAAVVAAMPADSKCAQPGGSVPVLFMNGSTDPILPWDGGQIAGEGRGTVLTAEQSVNIWRVLAGGGAMLPPHLYDFPDADPEDGTRVERFRYVKTGVPVVEMDKVHGGGHTEPSLTEHYQPFYLGVVGAQNRDIEMAEEVWRFFAAQPRW